MNHKSESFVHESDHRKTQLRRMGGPRSRGNMLVLQGDRGLSEEFI